MITIFHLLELLGFLCGAVVGLTVGWLYFGLIGALVGGLGGAFVGRIVGRVPWVLAFALMRCDLKCSSTEALRERLKREYYISHLIIAELLTRGEPVESFRAAVLDQLRSGDADVRRFGEVNAELWFPGLLGSGSAEDGEGPP